MRFTDGLWMHRSGLSIHNTHQMWEYRIEQDRIKAFVLCHCVEEADDYTAGTALEYTFSCPAPDMIAVDVVHFRGTTVKEPAFTLHYAKAEPQITDTAESLVMENGRMRLVIRKSKQFAYDFYFDGRHLTGSENGSTAYIADADYEADKVDDVNHRTPKKPYMHTVYLRERLQLGIGEAIYGLGERFTPLIRNGQVLDIWNRDGGSNCDQGYKCVPFYLSNLGYGVLVNTPDYVRFDVGMESVRHVQFSVEDEKLSYIVVGGEDAKDVLSRYTALIGRSPVPPVWTFGLWLSTSWIPDSTEKTALAAIDKMHEYGIPLSVYHFDARWMDDFHDCNFIWSDRFGDARVVVNDLLMHLEPLRPLWIPVNKHGSQNSLYARKFDEEFFGELPILTFPAGLCSRCIGGEVTDLPWKTNFLKKAYASQRQIVPVFVEGRLSNFFYRVDRIRRMLGVKFNIEMLWLSDEMFSQKGKHFRILVGDPIPVAELQRYGGLRDQAEFVRKKAYFLENMLLPAENNG